MTKAFGPGTSSTGHLAIADFDGDGKLDVFSANYNANFIMTGDGKGGFPSFITLSAALSGPDAFAVDVNGDGLPDLVTNNTGSFAVALNRGHGSFAPVVMYSSYIIATARGYMAVADINGDGHPDVVFTGVSTAAGQLVAALGRADGTFAAPTVYAATGLHNFSLVGAADLHGDGALRVFLAGTEGYGTVLGHSPSGNPMFEGSGIRQSETVLADFNGDGIMDIATPDDHAIVVLFGKADGTFASAQAQQLGSTAGYLQLADVNGDHTLDLIVSAPDLVFAGVGDGTFQTSPLKPPSAYNAATYGGGDVFPFYPANFNGDGKLDLLTLPEFFLFGNGDGSFTQASAPRVMGTPFSYGAVADFDGDGLDDGVEVAPTALPPPLGGVNVFMSRAQAFTQFSLPGNEASGPPATGDFNGDGCQDLAVAGAQHIVLYKGDCHGGLTYTTSYGFDLPAAAGVSTAPGDLTKADVDGDGHLDLIFTLPALNEAQVLYGNGDGTFTPGTPIKLSRSATFVSAADLDGDGRADLLFSGFGNPIVLYGSVDRTFAPERVLAEGFQSGKAALGDLRGIGKVDAVLPNLNSINKALFLTVGYTYSRLLNGAPLAGTSAISMTATASQSSITYGDAAVLALRVTATNSSAVPTGYVSLQVDGVAAGTAALDGQGQANLSLSAVDAGTHNLTATYLGDVNFRTGAVGTTVTVAPAVSTLALTVTPDAVTTLQGVSVTATVAAGSYVPVGQVQFTDGGRVLGVASVDRHGVATLLLPALSAGTHQIAAAFAGTQDVLASQSTAAVAVTVAPTTISILASPTSLAVGAQVSVQVTVGGGQGAVQPAGLVSCSSGATSLGTATITGGAGTLTSTALPAGADTINCTYTGNATFGPSTSADAAVLVSGRVSSGVSLTVTAGGAAATSVAAGTVATLTAQVQGNGAPVTPGQVLFCDNAGVVCDEAHQVGTAQLNGQGAASVTTVPAPGTHSYTARFVGVSAFYPAQSGATVLTVTGNKLSTATLASAGVAGNYTLTAELTGAMAATGAVSFVDTTNGNALLGTSTLIAGNATFGFATSTVATPAYTLGVSSGDFNGDGVPDLAVQTGTHGGIVILLGKGDGSFLTGQTLQTSPNLPNDTRVTLLKLGDFNADGKTDIAAVNYFDKSLAIFFGNGDGTFSATPVIDSGAGVQYSFTMTVADVNGDGFADLVGADQSDNDGVVLLGKGDGTFTKIAGPQLATSPRKVISGDFNEDGIVDLAFSTGGQGTLSILLGNGDGSFRTIASPTTGPWPISLTTADFNGDGHLDLAVTDDSNFNVRILLGNGDGTFRTLNTTYPTDSVPIEITSGDFNGDGKVDLAVANELGNSVTLLLGNGDGTFATSSYPVGKQPEFLVAADLNRDGRSDLVVGNVGESDATVMVAKGAAVSTATLSNLSVAGAGTHQIQASYAGDTNYGSRLTNLVALSAQALATTLKITAVPQQAGFGQSVTLTATLAPASLGSASTDGETINFLNGSTNLGTCVLNSGTCSLTLANLNAGSYTVSASYAGDTSFQPSTSAPVPLTVQTGSAPISFSVPDHTFGDAPFTVMAKSASSGALSYSVVSGPATVAGTTITLTGAGTVVLQAQQAAAGNYAAGTQTASFHVSPGSQTISLSLPAAVTYGTAPVTVSAQSSSGLPVTLSVLSGPGTLSGNLLTLTGAGTVVVAADQAGNTNYSAAVQVQQSIQVSPQTVTLNWPPPAALTYGASLKAALSASTGTAQVPGSFAYFAGTAPVDANTVLAAGSYTLRVQFTPADTARYTGATASVPLVVGRAGSSTVLSTSANAAFTGNPVVLNAAVTAPGNPVGTVTFLNGTSVLGTGTLVSGVAQFTVTSLPVGTQALSAVFSGGDNFNGSTSAVVSVAVQDFALNTPSQAPVVTVSGTSASTTFVLNSTGQALPTAVTFSASGLPPGATATFSPASLPAGSTATSVSVTFTLPATTARVGSGSRTSGAMLALLLLVPVCAVRGGKRRERWTARHLTSLLILAAAPLLAVQLSGCGGGASAGSTPKPAAQTYVVTLTATSGAVQRSTTVTLQVQ